MMDHIRKLADKIWGGMRMKEKKDPRFLPPKKPVEYKGLSFEEAKEILGERFDGSPHVWYLLNMAVAKHGKEYVRKHLKGFRQAGLGSTLFFDE
jgi:hypothetical protein